jgi:CRISPR/Cas system-associated exonuclease Cas4 (RecB family)
VPRALVRSPVASHRLERAAAWLAAQAKGREVLIVGATWEAASELTRRVARDHGASFGWHRATLGRVAAALAGPELSARGLAPVGALPLEALCARVVDALGRQKSLGRFAEVAHFPGLPRALARTLLEIRIAGLDPETLLIEGAAEIARVHQAYEAELQRAHLADRALVFRIAAEVAAGVVTPPRPASAAAGVGPILRVPLLLLDVPVRGALERDLLAAIAQRSPEVMATVPSGDERSLGHLREALEIEPEAALDPAREPTSPTSLRRLQDYLFSESAAPKGELGEEVIVLSAPGESRECVEIVRVVQQEAARGVPFDRMAILLRAPLQYRSHLEEALRRAGVPAFFAKGTVRPDPAGRAFVALLVCAVEKLSARRFAEYLSLGQVPDPTGEGAPPPPIPAAERWIAPDDELLRTSSIVDLTLGPPDALSAEDLPPEDDTLPPESLSLPPPAIAGTLRAPRRWERLLIESAVIGGLDRWEKRLVSLHRKLLLALRALDERGDPESARARRDLADLEGLRRFALPLLRALADLPGEATWGEWFDRLSSLATRALRKPERVLSVLAELTPMAVVGPVSLDEVRLILTRRLTELVLLPEGRASGRVFVAPVESARGLSFRSVFVPGLAEKLFPQKVSEDPVLLDRLRAPLGLDTNHERVAEERLALRLAVGAAEERLLLSYPRVDMDQSRPRVPSFYGLEVIRAAEGRLPGFDELAQRAELRTGARIGWPAPQRVELSIDEAEYDLAVLETLFHRPEAETVGTAHYLLGENDHLARALRFRARRWTVKKWHATDGLVDPTGAARAALDQHTLAARPYAATALQTFAACPYKFLLHAVHRLGPRETPEPIEEMEPVQRGALMHEALYALLDALRAEDALPLSPETLAAARLRLDAVLDAVAARYKDELAPVIDRVWEDGIAGVRADLREWLRRASEEPGWVPLHFELGFGLDERLARDPASQMSPVRLDCGLSLRGSIDLVERSASGALRATDYKTGKPLGKPGATVVGGGQLLQPVLYALALEKLFPDERVEAGRLYFCSSVGGFEEVPIPLDREARRAAEQVAAVIGKALVEGFLPAAPEKGACERCAYRVVCGPYEEMRTARKSPERLVDLTALRRLP